MTTRYDLVLVAAAAVATCSLAFGIQRPSAETGEASKESTSGAETTEATASESQSGDDEQRVELGEVDWHRDFEAARAAAREQDKPMFVLFTEVPGCATVRGFGRIVLSDAFIVNVIESHFVPVAIFNNVEGEDREVLESFDEPTWNNPVARIIEPDRTALADRFAGPYSTTALLETIGEALEEAKGKIPTYLQLRDRELSSRGHRETAIFNMYCFWSGEAGLGRLDGVVRTRPGFLEGTEVVRVTYDSRQTSYEKLLEAAKLSGAASSVFATSEKQFETAESVFGDSVELTREDVRVADDDRKYHLQHSPWRAVEMTELQRTRVNSALEADRDPREYLSPTQREQVE